MINIFKDMPKPQVPTRKNTTISVSKEIKRKIRMCANVSSDRKGYEPDAKIIERIVDEYISNHNVTSQPHSTY